MWKTSQLTGPNLSLPISSSHTERLRRSDSRKDLLTTLSLSSASRSQMPVPTPNKPFMDKPTKAKAWSSTITRSRRSEIFNSKKSETRETGRSTLQSPVAVSSGTTWPVNQTWLTSSNNCSSSSNNNHREIWESNNTKTEDKSKVETKEV